MRERGVLRKKKHTYYIEYIIFICNAKKNKVINCKHAQRVASLFVAVEYLLSAFENK